MFLVVECVLACVLYFFCACYVFAVCCMMLCDCCWYVAGLVLCGVRCVLLVFLLTMYVLLSLYCMRLLLCVA